MKIFAYYLPQFHCIPENDKWWGNGFTEWTHVKKAKPLYKGHLQPQVPLNNNYYNLDDIETLKWQEKLLKSYNVDGLIFYHYYFTGKKLLEKPAEMLLKNKDLNIDFFFCWANHSWYRAEGQTKKLLLEQQYGNKDDWEEHFNYLLPFFKDDRYQKKNNKPILMVFKPDFAEKKAMFDFFNDKCIENGYDGICIIETTETHNASKINKLDKCKYAEYVHLREPSSVLDACKSGIKGFPKRLINKLIRISYNFNFNKLIKYDGNKLFEKMIKNYYYDSSLIRGLFFEWDNTPRHSYRGFVITPPDKKLFFKYMDLLKDNEYIFINAWNEWAEGMMLEPTEKNGYKYLEWIKEWTENENRTDGM